MHQPNPTIARTPSAVVSSLLLVLALNGCGESGKTENSTTKSAGTETAESKSEATSVPSLGNLTIDGTHCPITTAQARELLGQPVDQTQNEDFACVFATPGGLGADYSLSLQWDTDADMLGKQTGGDDLNTVAAPDLGPKAERYSYESSVTVANGAGFPVNGKLINLMVNVLPDDAKRGAAVAASLERSLARPNQ